MEGRAHESTLPREHGLIKEPTGERCAMSFAFLHARALLGIDARQVVVEIHLSNGLPGFALVGLPETAVRESKERVRSAILNSSLEFPSRRITVNLAPAGISGEAALTLCARGWQCIERSSSRAYLPRMAALALGVLLLECGKS